MGAAVIGKCALESVGVDAYIDPLTVSFVGAIHESPAVGTADKIGTKPPLCKGRWPEGPEGLTIPQSPTATNRCDDSGRRL